MLNEVSVADYEVDVADMFPIICIELEGCPWYLLCWMSLVMNGCNWPK